MCSYRLASMETIRYTPKQRVSLAKVGKIPALAFLFQEKNIIKATEKRWDY